MTAMVADMPAVDGQVAWTRMMDQLRGLPADHANSICAVLTALRQELEVHARGAPCSRPASVLGEHPTASQAQSRDRSSASHSGSPAGRLSPDGMRTTSIPHQLKRLPVDRLRAVCKALTVLREAGLSVISDLEALEERVTLSLAEQPQSGDIVPVWVSSAVETEKASSLRSSSPIAGLAVMGSQSPVEVHELAMRLSLNNERERVAAARKLGCFGEAAVEALPNLRAALEDPEEEVRCSAAGALVTIGPVAVPELRLALLNGSRQARFYAASALGSIGAPGVAMASELLDSEDEDVRYRAAQSLALMGAAASPAVPYLKRVLNDRDEDVRMKVAEALGQIGAAAAPSLAEEFNSDDAQLRYYACWALGQIGISAVPHLRAGLRHERHDVRCNSATALGNIGRPAVAAVPDLLAALEDPDPELHERVEQALSKVGESAVCSLTSGLGHDKGFVRKRTVQALGEIGKPASPSLSMALEHDDAQVRHYAGWALGGSPRARIRASNRILPHSILPGEQLTVVPPPAPPMTAVR